MNISKKSEIVNFFARYLPSGSFALVRQDNEQQEADKLLKLICGGGYIFDAPDGVIVDGDMVYMLEHFRFSSQKRNRKGDSAHVRCRKLFGDKYLLDDTDDERAYKFYMNLPQTPLNLMQNFCSAFIDHASKREVYKKCVIALKPEIKDYTFKFVLVCEDRSLGGNYAKDKNGRTVFVSIFALKEALEQIKDCDFDYLLIGENAAFFNNKWLTFSSKRRMLEKLMQNKFPSLQDYDFIKINVASQSCKGDEVNDNS
jgi:hypothetical protein